jgi:hypothetical protein
VLEIGSNDGPFISNFKKEDAFCVEPCDNFAEMTGEMGYRTWTEFWTTDLANKIKESVGEMDLIYSANCICHIQDLDDCFSAVSELLSDKGVFVFEDPSLLRMLERGSYDQIYDEHAHVFSVTALDNTIKQSVSDNILNEKLFGINEFSTYVEFAERVEESKRELIELLRGLKFNGKRVVSIGATSKSTTVFNYCEIGPDLIECITDTTPDKLGTIAPGSSIPVVSRDSVNLLDYDYAFLGAWNFKSLIANAEREFVESGGQFITHVPKIMTFS